MTPPRKRPHCHTCGSPMAGHRRRAGVAVCPNTVPPSPPASPGTSVSPCSTRLFNMFPPLAVHDEEDDDDNGEGDDEIVPMAAAGPSPPTHHTADADAALLPSPAPSLELEYLNGGIWSRRQNPNWEPTPRSAPPPRFRSPTPASDLVPTERVDGSSIVKCEQEEEVEFEFHDGTSDNWDETSNVSGPATTASSRRRGRSNGSSCETANASDSFFDSVLRNSDALASVFDTPREEVQRVSDAAKDLGLHFGMIHRPKPLDTTRAQHHYTASGASRRATMPAPPSPLRSSTTKSLKRDNSWWMVIGKSGEAVNLLLDLQLRAMNVTDRGVMPGGIGPDSELAYTPRLTNFLQLAIAGIFGGLVVVYGLAWLDKQTVDAAIR